MQNAQHQPPLTEGDIPQLLQLLQSALSPDPSVQKQAEALLASLGSRVGYCSCLAAVIGNQEADHSARWLAAVQLKNSVNKYWRPRYDSGGLTNEEKAYLRGRFLQLIPQDDNQIAVQVALVVAKVARFDFPQQWPSLFHDLLAGIAAADGQQQQQQPSALLIRRTYFVLHHVLKELSTKRLAADQKAFAEVTQLLFDHVWGSWRALCGDLLSAVPAALASGQQAAPPALLLAFERWLLLLKIIRRLLLFGFASDAKTLQPVPAVGLVAPELLQAAAALAATRSSSSGGGSSSSNGGGSGGGSLVVGRSQLSAMVERGMLKLIKTLSQVQQEHPWSFHHAGVLLPTLEHCYNQLLSSAGGAPFPAAREALLTCCCNCILGVLTCLGYQGRISNTAVADKADSVKQMSDDVTRQLTAWWAAPAHLPDIPALAAAVAAAGGQQQQYSRAAVLLITLVGGFFPLTYRDLEEWSNDSEQWAHSNSDISGSAEGLRPCCHQLALTLMLSHKQELAPVLVNILEVVSSVVPAGWSSSEQQQQQQLPGPVVTVPGGGSYPAVLLLKEAVYESVGLAAYELHDFVDYTSWLQSALLPEMMAIRQQQQQQRLLPVLPRAAAQLVGRWVADLKSEDRPAVYNALTLLLVQPQQQQQQQQQHEPDVVLQLAAVSSLRTLVDDFGFEAAAFVGVLPAVVTAVTGILRNTDELDTQNQAFGLLNLIIDRLGPADISPHVGAILPLLPDIWSAAEDQSLLRIQVLCCLSLLVNVLGPDSVHTYTIILPILQQALHPNSTQPELLEDGLCLWLVALRNAPGGLGQQQQEQVPGVERLFELTPALTACMTSSTEHIYLGMQIFSSLLLLGGAPFLATYGPQLLSACTAYVGEIVERGLLLMLPPMDLLLVAAPQQAAPMVLPCMQQLLGLVLSGRESGIVVANSLALFGRLLLQSPSAFEQLLGSAAAAGIGASGAGSVPEALLVALVSLWCEAFDSIAQPLARKLAACALATLIGLPVKALLHQLPLLLSNIVSVWLEVESSGDDNPTTDRGEMFYAQGLWSSGGGGYDDSCGFEDGGVLFGQSLTASEEAAGECARKQALRDAEPLRHIKLSRLLADKLAAAAAVHGQEFAAAMAALDPAIGQQVQVVMAAAAGQQQHHR